MRTMPRGRSFTLLALLATASCYSFAVGRDTVELKSEQGSTWVYVWYSDQTTAENTLEQDWPLPIVTAVVVQPINMLFGVLQGCTAPFNAEYDIRFGPIGFVAGVLVPGLTVMPALMSVPGTWPLPVDDAVRQQVLEGIDAGNGVAAFRAAAGSSYYRDVLAVERAPDPPERH